MIVQNARPQLRPFGNVKFLKLEEPELLHISKCVCKTPFRKSGHNSYYAGFCSVNDTLKLTICDS